MVPVELGVGSLRRDNVNLEQNMNLQQCELDFLKRKMAQLETPGRGVSTMHNLILQLEGEDEEISRGRPRPQKSSVQQRSPRPKLGRSIQGRRSINPRCKSISSFEWRSNPKIVEHRLFENVLSMIV